MSQIFYVSAYASLAAADSAATSAGGVLYIDTNVTLTANTTLSAREVHFAGGIITRSSYTLTCAGVIVAGDIKIFDAAGTGGITTKNGVVNAGWFGAVGDGTTDDTNALIQCQKCCDNSVVGTGAATMRLPLGTYAIAAPVPFYGSIIGDGSNATILVPKTAYASNYLIDFNYGTLGKELRGLTIDIRSLGSSASVTAFGSSSTYGGGGSSIGIGADISVLSSSTSTPAVRARSTGAEPGMFTGWLFESMQIAAPVLLEIGQNQDDCRFDILRLSQAAGGSVTPVTFTGTNVKLSSVYMFAANPSSPSSGLILLGSNVDIEGIFLEGTTNATWTFIAATGGCQARIGNIQTNLAYSGSSSDRALFRIGVPAGPVEGYGLTLYGNFQVTSGSLPYDVLFSFFCGTVDSAGPINISVYGMGWERWAHMLTAFAIMGSGGTANTNRILKFRGYYYDVFGHWDATAPASLNSPSWYPVSQPANWTNR